MRTIIFLHGLVGGFGGFLLSLGYLGNSGHMAVKYPAAAGMLRGLAIACALFYLLGLVGAALAGAGKARGIVAGLMVGAGVATIACGIFIAEGFTLYIFSVFLIAGGAMAGREEVAASGGTWTVKDKESETAEGGKPESKP